ncbi:MAG: SGNH/GDSL hydrolase family protein [Armatimonadetes bacterium]|nr:SGNH/GDSL hydrolase family protein [Armatimonadota bacterium]
MIFQTDQKIVFFGDSITEADPGYVSFVDEMLQALCPELRLTCVNRGVGGNKIVQLLERLERDVLSENPDWISVSIGINDVWHGADGVALPDFQRGMEELFKAIAAGSQAKVMLCTPSVIGEDLDNEDNGKLADYCDSAERIAREHGAVIVPIHRAFLEAIARWHTVSPEPAFTTDGVHLKASGNRLFGTTWLKAAGVFDAVAG